MKVEKLKKLKRENSTSHLGTLVVPNAGGLGGGHVGGDDRGHGGERGDGELCCSVPMCGVLLVQPGPARTKKCNSQNTNSNSNQNPKIQSGL